MVRTLLVFLTILLLFGCAPRPDFVWVSEYPQARQPEQANRNIILPGDTILVDVANHPEMSGQFIVGASGEYSHPVLGLVAVANVDPPRAKQLIEARLAGVIQEPQVSVTLLAYKPMQVTIVGRVSGAGVFSLPQGTGLLAALGTAGGLDPFAKKDGIYVLRNKPTPIRIRFRYDDLLKPDPISAGFVLQDGDTILVE